MTAADSRQAMPDPKGAGVIGDAFRLAERDRVLPVLGKLDQRFAVTERVRMNRTTDSYLDGQNATVLGKSADGLCAFYILGLDEPHPVTGYLAITLIESCIERISNHD
jgi:hypothetical protein